MCDREVWIVAVFFIILCLILMLGGVSCFIHSSIRSLNTCPGLACCRCWGHLPAGSQSRERDRQGLRWWGAVGRERQQALQVRHQESSNRLGVAILVGRERHLQR